MYVLFGSLEDKGNRNTIHKLHSIFDLRKFYVWLIISLGVPLTLKGRRKSKCRIPDSRCFQHRVSFSQSSLATETIFSCLPYIRCSMVLSQLNKKCCRHLGIGWLMEPECGGFFQHSPEAPSLKYIHDMEWLNLFIRLFLI